MFALIRKPAPNAMQSGTKSSDWIIEFPKGSGCAVDPLTGTTSSIDMLKEVNMRFGSKEDAIAYVKSRAIPYQVLERPKHKPIGRSYGDNFAFERKFPWTH